MSAAKLENYDSIRGAEAYKADYQRKLHRKVSDRLERKIFARFFGQLGPVESILDLPCGAGRLFSMLREQAENDQVIEADFSSTMLDLNRRDHDDGAMAYLRCSGLEIPLPDSAVELVVSVRLSHHLDRLENREQHLRELCRVARRAVILTWFSATSVKSILRQIRTPFSSKRPKNTMYTSRVEALAKDCGFRRLSFLPLSRLSSGHVFGLFERQSQALGSRP